VIHRKPPSPPERPCRRRERGIALIEAFLVVTILGMALLWHAATSLGSHRLIRAEGSQGVALETSRHFLERLRADPAWETLYARLAAHLEDGPPAIGLPPSAYYADFESPAALGTLGVLVEVPRAAAVGAAVADPLVLREDAIADRFGLPFDLSGDGVVDDQPHDGDYKALPVIVTFNWTAPGDSPQTLKVSTILRGVQ
jgi:hypothetical protein